MKNTTRFLQWEPEPDVYGYASAIAGPGGCLLAEATVTVPDDEDLQCSYDVIGRDGVSVVATGFADTPEEAMTAAEYAMRRLAIRAL
ncbi:MULTISPECIES: hypothetical protein [unclassified Mesorhizobium]|uniref:hypothetical protein n=1 Tax=unclassified Mesorhizobium TaxID=325217 RepID=UPI001093FCD2|nr:MULTISPECIES: hypothetical protein [unclassified Mesorhizobium]TGS40709.1 hypothetical protein EN825_23695 [Mesorhizobium sp. M8A.F.Ca.ET.182.01.1.1]TGS78820.1 hypothetical protein EN824_21105 [Mesorhizobium sp. M8A.F.Ca.ET.181.01.1.1]